MKFKRAAPITESQFAGLLVVGATFIGLLLRLALPLMSRFPLNDGGLFYAMIRDLQANGYALPAFTTYNNARIPFAYPPFAFYAAGFLSDLLCLDLLDILRLLPPIISAATIPVFYMIARELLPNKTTAALAALLFAFTPRIFAWMIMGGGITRSFGFLFAILAIASAIRLFSTHAARFIFWTSAWSTLTVVTHPEAIPQAALAALILYLFLDRSFKGFLQSSAAVALVLLLSAPWWLTILTVHGPDPFLAAATAVTSDSDSLAVRLFALFRFMFTDEGFLSVIAVLGLVGVFVNLARRKYLFPAWLVLAYLLEPRGGTLYMMLPLILCAAQGLDGIILSAFREAQMDNGAISAERGTKLFAGFLLLYLLVGGYASAYRILDRATLTLAQLHAMDWIRANAPPDAIFLVVTGEQPLLDPASDWFPALAVRTSAATVFGCEWIHDGKFRQRIEAYQSLQACAAQTGRCIESWSRETGIEFTHIYLQADPGLPLADDLQASSGYELLFQEEDALIFQITR